MTVIIAQDEKETSTLTKALEKLEKKDDHFLKIAEDSQNNILIIVDIPGLIGYPWSVQKDTLINFLRWLKEKGAKSISIFPTLPPNYRFKTVLSDLGLFSALQREKIHIIEPTLELPEKKTNNLATSITSFPFSHVFVITQVGLIDEKNLWTGSVLFMNLLLQWSSFVDILKNTENKLEDSIKIAKRPKDSENQITLTDLEDNKALKWIWNWVRNLLPETNHSFPNIFRDAPVSDEFATYFISLAFKCGFKNTWWYNPSLIPFSPKLIFVSNSFPEIETLTYQYLAMDPLNGILSNYFTVLLSGLDNIEVVESGESTLQAFEPPELNQLNLEPILPIEIYMGKISEEIKIYSMLLKGLLQSLLYEDFSQVKKIALLMGKNPPEPENADWILIFGDDAIETTLQAPFIYLNKNLLPKEPFMVMEFEIGGKSILSDDEIDREILKKQRKLRAKIEKLEEKLTLFQNSLSEKDLEEEKNLLILEAKKKTAHKIQKIRTKIEKTQYQVRMNNEIRKIKQQRPKLVPNPNIIRIPTAGMFGLDFLKFLQTQWSKKQAPALNMAIFQLNPYYQFPTVQKKWQKNLLIEIKTALETTMQEITDPLLPQINKKLKQINNEYQKKIAELKKWEILTQKKIETDFEPKIKAAKIALEKLKKEKKREQKLRMKEKFKKIYFLKGKSTQKEEMKESMNPESIEVNNNEE
ncbi:MAG: hypothetical protein DRO88_02130 [Promethearchaeia archaeon]|nr:MAG: hypothetical protein DRO88_02130 [Candidatus Lokiarchaeia archaeon]